MCHLRKHYYYYRLNCVAFTRVGEDGKGVSQIDYAQKCISMMMVVLFCICIESEYEGISANEDHHPENGGCRRSPLQFY